MQDNAQSHAAKNTIDSLVEHNGMLTMSIMEENNVYIGLVLIRVFRMSLII